MLWGCRPSPRCRGIGSSVGAPPMVCGNHRVRGALSVPLNLLHMGPVNKSSPGAATHYDDRRPLLSLPVRPGMSARLSRATGTVRSNSKSGTAPSAATSLQNVS